MRPSREQGEIWLADLNPRTGTEPGKVRPVVVIQTDLLNTIHPSTVICPITSKVQPEAELLRVHLTKANSGLTKQSDILVDQIRAIDNKRFIKRVGKVTEKTLAQLKKNVKIVLDLD
jgi:mRNA interferase MazF